MNMLEIRLGSTDTTCLYFIPDHAPWLGPCLLSISGGSVAEEYYKLLVSRGERLRGDTLAEFLQRANEHYKAALTAGILVQFAPKYKNFWYGVSLSRKDLAGSLRRRNWREPFWSGRVEYMRTIRNS